MMLILARIAVALVALSFPVSVLGAIKCKSSPMKDNIYYKGYPVDYEMMVDNEHHIVMDWTPKAACTRAVTMFLRHMNIIYDRDYSGWPHDFRARVFYKTCGYANADHFSGDNWLRIKVVRNPYIRLGSSYYHSMSMGMHNPYMVPGRNPQQLNEMSFADYLDYLESVDYNRRYDRHSGSHASLQHRPFEVSDYLEGHPSTFKFIIRSEDPDPTITQLNAFLKQRGNGGEPFNFTHTSYADIRDKDPKENVANMFIGNRPWKEIGSHHPTDYSVLYNDDLRRRASILYSWDLILYNYSWPF